MDGATDVLRPRLIWVTLFRTGAASLLLMVNGLRLLARPEPGVLTDRDVLAMWLVASIYLLVLVQSLFLRGSRPGARSVVVHVAGDVAIATVLVFLTGGPESPFGFSYLLAVVGAAILLGPRGAVFAAAWCALSFVALSAAVSTGVLRTPVEVSPMALGRLIFICTSNVLAQFLTAILAGFLAGQLSATGGRLSARERDLEELSRLQQQILLAMPSGLLTCDPTGKLTYLNRAAQQILGIAGNFDGRVDDLIPGIRTDFSGRPRSEVTVNTPAGQRTLGLTVSSLYGGQGDVLVVFQDLTELRRAEQELRRADRLAELGAFSAQLAHELRNPLAAMRGSAQLLGEGADPETRKLMEILKRESDRLSSLVERFLAFARPQAPSLRPCDLEELARQTAELLRSDPLASRVDIQVVSGWAWALVDPDQVRQVLLNLFRNALAAAGRGGRVRAHFSHAGEFVEVHVWDSGGSIATGDLPRIFEPFFSKRAGGTGLGLSTVHSIVRAHGGQVRVSSSRDTGTEFVVQFRAAEVRAA